MECLGSACTLGGSNLWPSIPVLFYSFLFNIKKWKLQGSNLWPSACKADALPAELNFHIWSGRRGSNSLPPPWQGGALPDELRPHIPFVFAGLLSGDVGYYTAHSGSCQPQIYIFLKKNVFWLWYVLFYFVCGDDPALFALFRTAVCTSKIQLLSISQTIIIKRTLCQTENAPARVQLPFIEKKKELPAKRS